MDEISSSIEGSLVAVGKVATHLFHPLAIGSGRDPGDLDLSGFEIDDEEHEIPSQACPLDHFYTEEVGCRDRACPFSEPVHREIIELFRSVLNRSIADGSPFADEDSVSY